ncbi:hypothetical protein DR950_15190 [Kitasatospora xanthocidica]|uniref:Uncharacterized protein n=1 Tax=Kitasatospora xanthocidica TaxID=83382 RepID=A0A372ZUN3_9ACTN|nr:hypothetical protein [Kitasatospora xanthocidica]RGD58945.1 hypothetical protein DR950_15190 [Kitasatospora xanthocidica]
MTDPLSEAWDFQAQAAAEQDDFGRTSGGSWIPPILRDLVLAARSTSLSRYYPFTSHATLRFSTGPQWWLGSGDVLAIGIALVPEGRYLVYTQTSHDEPFSVELETTGADEAAARAEQLVNALG